MFLAKLLILNEFLPVAYFSRVHYQVIVMLSIAGLIISLLVYMLFYMYFKSKHEKKHDKWRLISDLLIHRAVFYDAEEEDIDETEAQAAIAATARAKKLMHNKHSRKFVTGEILSAKKNMTGTASDNLKQLYQQLGLDKYALKSLKSRLWHIKAKAIQELTVMEMSEYVNQLYAFTNDQVELVRMEAQTAIVQFNGFEGLRFLDIITYPISDWQQIKLLQQLAHVPPVNISIDGWLRSENNSVVVFALKLARNYHRFELHDDILLCLDHADQNVRLEVINYLCEIYTDDTTDELISRFLKEDFKNQLAMIKAMQNIGSEKDILFLLSLLDNESHEMKLTAARALAKIGKSGLASLQGHALAKSYPLNEMVLQIKGELAA